MKRTLQKLRKASLDELVVRGSLPALLISFCRGEITMHIRQCVVTAVMVMAIQVVGAVPASAQGCILFRQTSPLFGTTCSLDQ